MAPHPDDEVLACGGLMCVATDLGLEVMVVAVTDGEACYPGESWWTPQRLRQARREEL
ncbi:PIG-L family deacetylase, partial [Salmonella enterica]|uniref:PIG-L family deacetylase n=1 Tax=Salmonella enterica TaxID=28901 RepID=UPI0034D977A8